MKIRDLIRNYVLSLVSLSMALFLLIHFALIWIYGKYYIYESNRLVLLSETTLIIVVLCFSLFCLLEQLFRKT